MTGDLGPVLGSSVWEPAVATILKLLCLTLVCATALAAMPSGYAQIPISLTDEYKAKARFLFNFGKFTTWPADTLAPTDRFKLCVLGKDPFGVFLELLAIRGIKGHEVDIVRLHSQEMAIDCHLLFLAQDAVPPEGLLHGNLAQRGLLLIADTPGLTMRGAVANLVIEADKVRFELNIDAARRAGLILDSQLLRLGRLMLEPKGDRP